MHQTVVDTVVPKPVTLTTTDTAHRRDPEAAILILRESADHLVAQSLFDTETCPAVALAQNQTVARAKPESSLLVFEDCLNFVELKPLSATPLLYSAILQKSDAFGAANPHVVRRPGQRQRFSRQNNICCTQSLFIIVDSQSCLMGDPHLFVFQDQQIIDIDAGTFGGHIELAETGSIPTTETGRRADPGRTQSVTDDHPDAIACESNFGIHGANRIAIVQRDSATPGSHPQVTVTILMETEHRPGQAIGSIEATQRSATADYPTVT